MLNQEEITNTVRILLDEPYWLPTIETQEEYTRRHDDTDGKDEGYLSVQFGPDGDAWINIDTKRPLRFRMPGSGGGQSSRTRNALMMLAEAIRLDNEEHKQE